MATEITYGPGGILDAGVHRVYTRVHWADPWVEVSYLHCEEAVWSAAPSMPTATLKWIYGEVAREDQTAFAEAGKKGYNRRFVKIEIDTEGGGLTWEWYGMIELENDIMGGAQVAAPDSIASGVQIFTAFGLAKLLAELEVRTAYVAKGTETEVTEIPPVFNRGGRPNRSTAKISGAYVFSGDPDDAEFWSSRDICEYLLRYQTPTDKDGTRELVFGVEDTATHATVVPDWDRPVLPQEGMTVYSLLDQLANRRRLLLWQLIVDGSDEVKLRTDTMVASAVSLSLPGASPIPANDAQRHLIFDEDQLTSGCVRTSDVDFVHQVIVRGARRRSVGSFSITDGSCEEGWTSDEEDEYSLGATQEPGFNDLEPKDKERRHTEVRSKPELEHVFSLFRIPKSWDRFVRNGEGGAANALFPVAGSTDPFPVYYPDMFVEQSLPLLEQVDYRDSNIPSGSITEPAEGERTERAPLVVLKIPGTSSPVRWIAADQIGVSSDKEITAPEEFRRFSVAVRVPRESKGIRLDVHGAPRHVLDGLGFDDLPEDVRLGEWSFGLDGGMIITLSLPDDRYCEGVSPSAIAGDDRGVVRRKIISAGDGYRKDYVAPGTVVAVDSSGALLRSDGGFIPHEHDNDDESKLTAAAQIAASWYTVQHFVLCLKTKRIKEPADLDVGDLVTTIGDATAPGEGHSRTLNSPVTEVKISIPLGMPDAPSEPEMTVTTWAGELDPLLLEPPDTAASAAGGDFGLLPPSLDLGVPAESVGG